MTPLRKNYRRHQGLAVIEMLQKRLRILSFSCYFDVCTPNNTIAVSAPTANYFLFTPLPVQ